MFICSAISAGAQTVDRNVAISAYIYNFAKNVKWQNEDSLTEFRFLVIGDDKNIIKELSKLSDTKTLRNKPIRVSSSQTFDNSQKYQLIFITKEYKDALVKIYDQTEGKNVLLVSDSYSDSKNIMINFYNSDNGSLLFEINKSNIVNQNISIMPDMILLGGTEVDVAALYFEGQQSLRSLQKQFDSIENNLVWLKENNLKTSEDLETNKDSLHRMIAKISEQQQILDYHNNLLLQRDNELNTQKSKIAEQQSILKSLIAEAYSQKQEILNGKKILQQQETEILEKKSEILSQSKILDEQDLTIERQRNVMYLLIIIVVLVFSLVLVIFNGYRNKQKMNRELENRAHQLTAINKELESFSYSISHDLRAPLRAIFGFSQILARRHRSSLNDEGQQYMDYIVQASVRMEQLINDLLNYSRLGRKSVEMRPVDLNNIVKNIHVEFRQKLDETGAQLISDTDLPVISGDESLVHQIFINLIENAITYRRTEVPLEIKISCDKNDKGYSLKISDNGIGIPREYWTKIFNIFQRLHSEDQYPGTGIGLATVQKAAGMLNGEVSVDSVVGEGSTFIINFKKQ